MTGASETTSEATSEATSETTSEGLGPRVELAKRPRSLLSVADLAREGIEEVLALAGAYASARSIEDVGDNLSEGRDEAVGGRCLAGRTVATLFFEASTRTRLSFELAARRLGAEILSFTPESSSVTKGESLRDTVETIEAMGVDAIVVRHRSAGVPAQISRVSAAAVLNGGDGWHEHPTQALLDCYTILEALRARQGDRGERASARVHELEGLAVAIVGDVKHSRVARSNCLAFSALGAQVTLVGPPTLLPNSVERWSGTKAEIAVSNDLDAVLVDADVVYLLRLQSERMAEALLPSTGEYVRLFGLTTQRARRLRRDVLVLHPGPMNRGVEVDSAVTDRPGVLVTRQVRNGVFVRMAVLDLLIGSKRGWR
jgi:aspartate carbamoyltransferase catalytic subunit